MRVNIDGINAIVEGVVDQNVALEAATANN